MSNPLLDKYEYIPFGKFNTKQLEEALIRTLNLAKFHVTQVEELEKATWEQINQLLHINLYQLNQLWGLTNHLLAVNDSPDLRSLQDKFQPQITDFYVSLGQNKKIYNHYKWIKKHEYKTLGETAKKVIDNEFREFFLSGIDLNETKKSIFKNLQNELGILATKFEQNVLDATDQYTKLVTIEQLPGVPDDILQILAAKAAKDGHEGLYKLSLHAPCYIPIMQYCDNRNLREELYQEYVTRASELGSPELDNTQIISQILKLREEKAKILNFNNYTELSLYTKMAENSKQILDFLYQLAGKSKAHAIQDINELKDIAKKFNIQDLKAWDIQYFSEKLQQEKYSYSNEELKQYFQLPIVIDGLFKLINQLYNIEFNPNYTIPTWHTDMQTFDVIKNGKIIGNLYMDLGARNGKQPGAWMNSARDRFTYDNKTITPQTYIICNFTPPLNGLPTLLTFDEVQTLFHEMGHALHHLLTEIDHFAISGINGVEWDAVELPSQFMEYFTWNYHVLRTISKRVGCGSQLPLELYNKLLASRYYQSGLQMLRQIEFAIFDLSLHQALSADIDYNALLNQIRKDIAVIIPPKYNRFPNTFSHIFAGGYASGYYSYKWAEVLATDIFAVFDNAGVEQYSNLGQKFHDTILSQGGLNPMLKNFKSFMGRIPQVDALLKYSGIE
ncbi:MAG: oligopeptidase [Burkholderiales bacterium]|nr:oligopeptidase [Burkholderiales bacterium]